MNDHLIDPSSQSDMATPLPATASLAYQAIETLRRAASIPLEERTYFREERNVWRPDSWLLSRCRESLAGAGAAEVATQVASLVTPRDPLAIAKTVHLLAAKGHTNLEAARQIYGALAKRERLLFGPIAEKAVHSAIQELLLSAATYALLGNPTALFTYLERFDQLPDAWDRVFADSEQRALLAETLTRGGRHPLTASIMGAATRRYDEKGADLLQRMVSQLDGDTASAQQMIERCATVVRYASLTTMHGHRLAVAILASAGRADEVMSHLNTISNIQEARRESGLALRRNDQQLLRQVKRPQANPDVDFQVYTLQEALRVMPVRRIPREQRAEMAKQLAMLGMTSDGWTAAGAAASLVRLGALKLAVDVVDNIAPTDPTRGEGAIALVSELLRIDEPELAAEQTQKAVVWMRSTHSHNVERATIWGLVEVYLDNHRPQEALDLLALRAGQAGLLGRLRGIFDERVSDDDLRNGRYRFQAYLQQNRSRTDVLSLAEKLRTSAPKLLEGDALTAFLIDGLLAPMIAAGYMADIWSLLTDIQNALQGSTGDRHAAHLQRISALLAADVPLLGEADRARLTHFLSAVWQNDAEQGIWQAVHGVEGSLPLLIALEGPTAILEVAQVALNQGESWLPPPIQPELSGKTAHPQYTVV